MSAGRDDFELSRASFVVLAKIVDATASEKAKLAMESFDLEFMTGVATPGAPIGSDIAIESPDNAF